MSHVEYWGAVHDTGNVYLYEVDFEAQCISVLYFNHILRDSFCSNDTFSNIVGKLIDMCLNMIDRATLAQV